MFIDIGAFEDPATGKPLHDSPIECLKRDLTYLQEGSSAQQPGLRRLISADRSRLIDRDLGAWQAAADLRATTDTAHSSISTAITHILTVYESIVTTLEDTVKAAKAADRATAEGLKQRKEQTA
ncbi:hypothetical protein [Nonomuraea recticatena]